MSRLFHSERGLHRFLLANMAAGLLVFAAAVYFIVTGEYESLAARQHTEAMLNRIAIGGLLYVAFAWYGDRFYRPLLFTRG